MARKQPWDFVFPQSAACSDAYLFPSYGGRQSSCTSGEKSKSARHKVETKLWYIYSKVLFI